MRVSAYVVAAGLALSTSPAVAQGFGVFEQGTCAMARAGAVVARGCGDGSSIFFNPAGILTRGRETLPASSNCPATAQCMIASPRWTITAGVTFIDAKGSFTDDATATQTDLTNDPIPVPHAYVTYSASDKLALGAGLFVPYGLGTKWPTTFEGRFNGYDNKLQTIYVQPTLAYALTDRISLGAGLDIAIGSVQLNQYVDLSENNVPGLPITFGALGIPFHTQFATAKLDASGATGFGGNFGVSAKVTDQLTFGARYMMRVKLDYSGTATFTPAATGIVLPAGNPLGAPAGTPLDSVVKSAFAAGGPLVAQTVSTSITMPDQFVAGLSYEISPGTSVEADYQWVHWSLFATLPVNLQSAPSRVVTESYQDTHGLRLGGTLAASENLTLRGGWIHHGAAAPAQTVTPLLPEGPRNEFSAGLGLAMSSDLEFNLAYQYIRQDNRRGRVTEGQGGAAPTVALNSGLYEFAAHLIGATLTFTF